MTDDRIALRTLLEKGSDAMFLREMIGFAAQRLIELETEGLCGAGHGERSPDRQVQRNGYRERDWQTRAGIVSCVSSSLPPIGENNSEADHPEPRGPTCSNQHVRPSV